MLYKEVEDKDTESKPKAEKVLKLQEVPRGAKTNPQKVKKSSRSY